MITKSSHISRIMNLCASGVCTGTRYFVGSGVHYKWYSDHKAFHGMRGNNPTGNIHYRNEFGADPIWVPHGLCKQAKDKFPDWED